MTILTRPVSLWCVAGFAKRQVTMTSRHAPGPSPSAVPQVHYAGVVHIFANPGRHESGRIVHTDTSGADLVAFVRCHLGCNAFSWCLLTHVPGATPGALRALDLVGTIDACRLAPTTGAKITHKWCPIWRPYVACQTYPSRRTTGMAWWTFP